MISHDEIMGIVATEAAEAAAGSTPRSCSPLPCDELHTTVQHCFDVWSEGADIWRRESSHGAKVYAVEAQQAFLAKWPGAITRIVEKTTTERVVNNDSATPVDDPKP